jgi:hypothetical protein
MTFIYGLVDCSTNELVYVGRTTKPVARMAGHKSTTIKNHGKDCRMEILEQGESLTHSDEYWWISYMRYLGFQLLNKAVSETHFKTSPYRQQIILSRLVEVMEAIRPEEIASKSGLSMSTVQSAKKGHSINLGTAQCIANALKVKREDLT